VIDNISDELSRQLSGVNKLPTVKPIDLRTEFSILRLVQNSNPRAESSKRDKDIIDL